jgi:DNA repair ATPase RecN
MKITIQGYQSIRREITLEVVGLTVITGESNIGKSAIVRAVIALLQNQRGSGFISKGMDKARVSVENLGHSVTWEKGQKNTSYTIDGEVHNKAGTSTPKEVGRLGFFEVTAGDRTFYPQIHEQGEKPFLIGENSPVAAAQLVSANKVNQIATKAVKNAQKDADDKKGVLAAQSTLLTRSTELEVRLKELEPQVQAAEQALDTAVAKREALEKAVANLQRVKARWEELTRLVAALENLKEVKAPQKPAQTNYPSLKNLKVRWDRQKTVVLATSPLKELLKTETPSATRWSSLRTVHGKLQTVTKRITATEIQLPQVNRVTIEVIQRPKKLSLLRKNFREAAELKSLSEKDQAVIIHELDTVERDRKKIIKEVGLCPYCGK